MWDCEEEDVPPADALAATATLRVDDEYTMVYYNARNGWKHAVEAIGVSRLHNSAFGL